MSGAGPQQQPLRVVTGGKKSDTDPTPDQLRRAKADELEKRARAYEQKVDSDATRRNYESDWRHFSAWCAQHGHETLPASPETVRAYLSDHARVHRPSTLSRRLVAITRYHRVAGLDVPTRTEAIQTLLKGIRRTEGTRPDRKAPILLDELQRMIRKLRSYAPHRLWGYRDRALLLIGWAGAMRRSEIVALNVSDITLTPAGLEVLVRQSKTDQEGKGKVKAIKYGQDQDVCPVIAYLEWMEASGIKRGPVFRYIDRWDNVRENRLSGRSVADIVKDHAGRAGLDPTKVSGHSLRSGLATTAYRAGVPERVIALTTGHKSLQSLGAYIRDSDVWVENAAERAGL